MSEPGWPKVKIQTKLAVIVSERAEIEGQLTDTTTKLDARKAFFLTALELLRDPQAFYRRGSMGVKHALAKVIFSKLYLDMGDTALVNSHDLTPGIGGLIETRGAQPDVLPAQRHPERLGGRHLGSARLERQQVLPLMVVPKGQSHSSEGRPP